MQKHTAGIEIDHQKQDDWVRLQNTKLLMTPRSRLVEYVIRIGIFLTLIYQSNAYVATAWLMVSVFFDLRIAKEINHYKPHAVDQASETSNVAIVARYKRYWYLNMLCFGSTALIFTTQQDVESQMVMICFLNLITILSETRTSAHVEFCHRIIFTVIFSQVIGLLWNAAFVFNFAAPNRHYIYVVYLLFLYTVLVKISKVYAKYLNAHFKYQFRNKRLIEALKTESTLREQQRKIAIAANETIQRFYSNAAHDVRQPVYAMQMYASMLHDDTTLGDVLLPKIQQSCIGINTLFNSLFDFQQLKLGAIEYKPVKININQLLQELNTQFAPLAQKKNLQIQFKSIEGDVFIDDILIKRVVGNLITNAIKYTSKGDILVVVRHRKNKKMLNFEIWDSGQGISEEDKANIFNEFFKVSNQKIEADEGFGLGLSIVRQLAQLVAGSEITVKSRLRRGSVFKFSVPDALYSVAWAHLKNELSEPKSA